MIEELQPFAISFVIGLLIGIERERNIPKGIHAIGMRTFVFFALLGMVSAQINHSGLTLTSSLFVFMTLLINYYTRVSQQERTTETGVTTEVSAGLVYLLGYLSNDKPILCLVIGFTTLLLLLGRKSLHQFARDKITQAELQALVTILIISLGILSFLPNKAIGPWQLFNPQQFGLILLILSVIQFGSYMAIKIFGKTLGMVLTGFFGGVISSTAMFASLSSESRKQKHQATLVIAADYAIIGTLLEFFILIMLISPKLSYHMLPYVLPILLVGVLGSYLCWKLGDMSTAVKSPMRPLDLKAVLLLAFLLIGILMLVTVVKHHFGEQALYPLSFIMGLFDLQAFTYATAVLYSNNQITLLQAIEVLGLAISAGFVSKLFILWIIARNRFAFISSMVLFIMWLSGAAIYFLV